VIPYGLAAKVGACLLAVLLLVGMGQYLSLLRRSAASAQETAARLQRELEIQKANGAFTLKLAARNADRERKAQQQTDLLRQEVRNARKPLPANCVSALAPVQRSLDGLRRIQGNGGARTARPELPARSSDSGKG
jgi:hypothetical protein